jgi:DNA-directed RNA polymerase subunit beta'
VIATAFARKLGKADTIDLLDRMKEAGFRYSTLAACRSASHDLRVPAEKQKIIDGTRRRSIRVERQLRQGRHHQHRAPYNQLIDVWATPANRSPTC